MSKKNPLQRTVILEDPIKMGDKEITSIDLRKPNSGELRGLTLTELLQMDVGTLHKLIPRISTPTIPEALARTLSPADLVQIGSEVSDFLLPKTAKEEAYPS